MASLDLEHITRQVSEAARILLEAAQLKSGSVVVAGCSTSEIVGHRIGTAPSLAIGQAVLDGLLPATRACQVYLAVQCCEHLNRALVVEEALLDRYGLQQVTVVPALKAGGALAVAAYQILHRPVLAQSIQAHAGLDIGATLIGMHLRPVVVAVRAPFNSIGHAPLVMARTRPPLIGGERAVYTWEGCP